MILFKKALTLNFVKSEKMKKGVDEDNKKGFLCKRFNHNLIYHNKLKIRF